MSRFFKRPIIWLAAVVLLIASALGAGLLLQNGDPAAAQARIISAAPTPTGFAQVTAPPDLAFPADHGPHPAYQTEWWYYTGNLTADDGRRFGYQLTFFRRALQPADQRDSRPSAWAADQVYMAHFALTDVAGRNYYAFERFSRGAADLAGAQAEPYHVWLENWAVQAGEDGSYRMQASAENVTLTLSLVDLKGPVLQGQDGYSQKGPERGNASVYYSLTRLQSSGTVTIGRDAFSITGLSWMDHEYSTSALSEGQIGWDWFSLQLDENTELMLYHIRRDDGSIDLYSKGTIIHPDGSTTTLDYETGDYQIEVLDTWRSPHTAATYPARWQITIPDHNLTLNVEPLLNDQELLVSYAYWEGAVSVEGEYNGRPVSGAGYVELTGYASSMEGEF